MFGLGNLAEACETAYNQGDEKMYAAFDNRLLTGYEYTAKYNLGESVPFTTWTDISGRYCNWQTISDKLRGVFRPIYEIVYNHYVTRKGLDMPYTRRVLSKMSVEGASNGVMAPAMEHCSSGRIWMMIIFDMLIHSLVPPTTDILFPEPAYLSVSFKQAPKRAMTNGSIVADITLRMIPLSVSPRRI